MINQLYSFAAGLVALFVYMSAFLIIIRLFPRTGWVGVQVMIGTLVHLLSTFLYLYFWDGFLYWNALGIFAAGWFCFFTLSTAIYVSISARILRTLDQRPGHAMPVEEIFNDCVQKPFEERANFLVKSGLAQKREAGFIITDQGRKSASQIATMRKFWGMEGAGLYSTKNTVIKND